MSLAFDAAHTAFMPVPPLGVAGSKHARLSLSSAFSEIEWRQADHRYSHESDGKILMQSEDGDWGVLSHRGRNAAIAELVIARLAAFADAPIAPTFTRDAQDGMHEIISIVPFEKIIAGARLPLGAMASFQDHYAQMLPFILWLGPDMDRHPANICMDAESDNFAHFDFEATSLRYALDIADGRMNGVDTYMYNLKRLMLSDNIEAQHLGRISRTAFANGLAQIQRITPHAVAAAIAITDDAMDLTERERTTLFRHIEGRRARFARALQDGSIEKILAAHDQSAPGTPETPAVGFRRHTYAFA